MSFRLPACHYDQSTKRNMTMRVTDKLTRDERREIEALLVSEIERLERSPGLFDSADEDDERTAWSDGPVSDGVSTPSPSTMLYKVAHYQALTDALQRLRAGTYGRCIYCGNLISASRLLVIPETEQCRKCGSFS
jgi:RNA polymerase-binding transcription factor DksA